MSWDPAQQRNEPAPIRITPMEATGNRSRVLAAGEGLRLQSGPGRDLIFKVTCEDTGGAFDFFIVEAASRGGRPLHVRHRQEEAIHVLRGRYKIQAGDDVFYCEEGGFAYLPSRVPHAFLNLTDEPGEIIVVHTPGGGHRFYQELGPASRSGTMDRAALAAIFERHDMALLVRLPNGSTNRL